MLISVCVMIVSPSGPVENVWVTGWEPPSMTIGANLLCADDDDAGMCFREALDADAALENKDCFEAACAELDPAFPGGFPPIDNASDGDERGPSYGISPGGHGGSSTALQLEPRQPPPANWMPESAV